MDEDNSEENIEEMKKHLEEVLRECKEGLKHLTPPISILRTDSGGSRRRLSIDVTGNKKEQVSPQASVDRGSVTFAEDSIRSDSSSKCPLTSRHKLRKMEKQQSSNVTDEEETEDEDYSASVNAIMQRRASVRKSRRRNSRRASSPFNPEMLPGPENVIRRRSSVYTSSSGETAITVEDSIAQEMTQEQIFENIKLHKEVLSNVKMQPWNMRRKLKLVVQAKNYVKKHEGALQERFTQSRSLKDMFARWNIYLVTKWQHYKREMANFSIFLIPWELRIKEIESHFGSVVASYFIFLRWLFWVNIVTAAVLLAFLAIPEMLTANWNDSLRKKVLPEEKYNSTNFLTLWDFEGVLKYTPLFYGWYTHEDSHKTGYRLPLAYFMTQLVVYVYSFIAILRKMAENSRMSKLSEKEDECVFTWKVFTGWDYMIGNAETAHNRVSSIVMSFKEALVEEAEKKRDSRNWKIISSRVFVNLMVINLLIISAVIVVEVVRRSTEPESMTTIWRRNEITVVLSLISTSFPMGFEILGIIEKYHPRKALRIHLARIMVLNLLNVYSLIFAQFDKIGGMTARLNDIKPLIINITNEKIYVSQTYGNNGIIECICDGENSYPFTTSMAPNILTTASPHLENATVDFTSENNSSVLMENYTSSISDIVYNVTPETDRSSEINEYTTEIFSTIPYTEGFTEMYSTDETSLNTTENETIFYDNNSTKWNDSNDSFINTTDTYYDSNMTSEETWLDRSVDISGEYYDYYDSSSSKNEKNTVTPTSEYEYDWDDNQTETESKKTEVAFGTAETYYENSSVTIETPITKSIDLENLNTSETITPNGIENFSEYFKKVDTKASTFDVSDNVSEYYKKPPIKTEPPGMINKGKVDVNTFTTLLKKLPSPTVEYTPFIAIPTCEMLCRNWTLNQTIPNDTYLIKVLEKRVGKLSYDRRRELNSLCWETMFGQELVKIVIMDLIVTALGILAIDFFRGLFLRVMNRCWCWDLEKKFPEYGEFKVAENILHLVNNQGMVWMGMFFSPGLAWINVIKLYILMYLRSWTVLTCNVPHSVVFRASRSNNFYFTLLLMMLFLCTLPVGYAVVWVQPSWHCGPFSNYKRIFHIFTTTIKSIVPENLHRVLDYIASPGIIIPLLVLLILIIYYLVSLTNALREANNDLKIQLRQERTEERRKMFKLVDKRRRVGSGGSGEFDNTPFARWKKLLNNLPSQKSLEEIVKEPEIEIDQEQKDSNRTREILTKFIRKALRKGSTSEEENPQIHDDATDNEQHESLPEDINTSKQETHVKEMRSPKSPRRKSDAIFSNFQNTVHSVLSRKKSNSEVSKSTTIYPKSSSSPISKSASPKEDSSNDHKPRKDDMLMKWTENIPLITISKTESDESLLNPTSTPDLKVKLAKKLIEKPKKETPAETDEVFESRKTPTALKHRKGRHTKGKEKHLQKQKSIDNNDGETCENVDKYKSSLSI